MPLQGGAQTLRKEHDPALVSFGLVNVQAAVFEIEVFNSQIKWLTHPQATGIEQVDDEPRGIAMKVGHVGQELECLFASGTIAQGWGPLGAERVDLRELLFEDVAIEKEQGVEGLVLS